MPLELQRLQGVKEKENKKWRIEERSKRNEVKKIHKMSLDVSLTFFRL